MLWIIDICKIQISIIDICKMQISIIYTCVTCIFLFVIFSWFLVIVKVMNYWHLYNTNIDYSYLCNTSMNNWYNFYLFNCFVFMKKDFNGEYCRFISITMDCNICICILKSIYKFELFIHVIGVWVVQICSTHVYKIHICEPILYQKL